MSLMIAYSCEITEVKYVYTARLSGFTLDGFLELLCGYCNSSWSLKCSEAERVTHMQGVDLML